MAEKLRKPISGGFLGALLGLFVYLFLIPANPGTPATRPQQLEAQIFWIVGIALIGGLVGEAISWIVKSGRNG
jgi:hypothetical protein